MNKILRYSILAALVCISISCSGLRVRENEIVVGVDGKARALPKRELLAIALMSKQSIGKLKAEGLAEVEDVLQDSTDVPKAITTAVTTYGLGKVAGDVAKAASADKARVDIGAQKASVATEGIKAKAATTSEAIKAGTEVTPISINAP